MTTRRGVRGLVAALALIVAAAATGVAAPGGAPARAHHINIWYEGLVEYSTIVNCFSIIGGYPYTERGAAAWM